MDQINAMLLSMASEALAAGTIGLLASRQVSMLAAVAAILGTMLTHPFVWHGALQLYEIMDYWPAFAIVETFAIVCETLSYRLITEVSWPRAFGFSFAANWASILLGWTLLG
jgi:hypothetical protein